MQDCWKVDAYNCSTKPRQCVALANLDGFNFSISCCFNGHYVVVISMGIKSLLTIHLHAKCIFSEHKLMTVFFVLYTVIICFFAT